MRRNLSTLVGLVFTGCLMAAPSALAETIALKASLNASSEVPSNNSKGTGAFSGTYDTVSKKLSWTVTYSGLTGNATAAHFHGPAEAGKNAGVAVPIPNIGTSPTNGSATLTDVQAADLLAGKYYANIHTAVNPGGEIRGQVIK